MAENEMTAPRIVTSRVDADDSYTMERYLATGGYQGLRKAIGMTPRRGPRRGERGEPARPGRGRVPGRPQVVDGAPRRDDLPRR